MPGQWNQPPALTPSRFPYVMALLSALKTVRPKLCRIQYSVDRMVYQLKEWTWRPREEVRVRLSLTRGMFWAPLLSHHQGVVVKVNEMIQGKCSAQGPAANKCSFNVSGLLSSIYIICPLISGCSFENTMYKSYRRNSVITLKIFLNVFSVLSRKQEVVFKGFLEIRKFDFILFHFIIPQTL